MLQIENWPVDDLRIIAKKGKRQNEYKNVDCQI